MRQAAPVTVGLREQRKREVRGRIHGAAIALFAERGCETVTVEEICVRAAVARKTFYNYYPNKQELINALCEHLLLDDTFNRIGLAMARCRSTAGRLCDYFDGLADKMQAASELERELILQSLYAVARDSADSGRQLRALNACFLRVFSEGQRQGDVSLAFSAGYLAEMTVGALNGITLNWVHDRDYPIAPRLQELSRMITRCVIVDDDQAGQPPPGA